MSPNQSVIDENKSLWWKADFMSLIYLQNKTIIAAKLYFPAFSISSWFWNFVDRVVMRVSFKNYFWLWWWRQWNLPEMSFILISCKIIRSGIFVIIMLSCWWVALSRVSCKNYFWLWRWRQGNLPEMSFILISWKKENIPSYFALWLALLGQKGLK